MVGHTDLREQSTKFLESEKALVKGAYRNIRGCIFEVTERRGWQLAKDEVCYFADPDVRVEILFEKEGF